MKSLLEYLNESVNDLKKQAKSLIDEYADYDEEDAAELLERAMDLILSAKNLNKNEVSEVEEKYAEIDTEDPDEVEEVLELAMNLVLKIK